MRFRGEEAGISYTSFCAESEDGETIVRNGIKRILSPEIFSNIADLSRVSETRA